MSRGNKKVIVLVCCVAVAIIASLLGYIFAINKTVSKWENKIYKGISVGQVDLSGKTKEEAEDILNEEYKKSLDTKVITAKRGNKEYNLKYKDLKIELNISEVVEQALKEGKDKNIFEKNKIINEGVNKQLKLSLNYDTKVVNSFAKKVIAGEKIKPKNATLSLKNGNITITKSVNGITVDSEKLNKLLKDNINEKLDKNVTIDIPVKTEEAKIKSADLKKIDGKISGFSTVFNPAEVDRSKNLELAARFINGTILMPGETFSYNETVGERTAARGFRNGAVFINNKVEDALGGGVCQVSTTLYRAVMAAGIKSVERHNHSLKTSYSDYGLDATVAWGYLDYKFKNTYDFPIYIEGYTSSNKVIFNIYGNKASLGGKTYDIAAEIIKRVEPSIKVVKDSNLYVGEEEWETKPITGIVTNTYRLTYQNGRIINREFIGKDTYSKVNGVKKVGTKVKEEPVAPQPPQPAPETPPTPPTPPVPTPPGTEVPTPPAEA